MLAKWATVMLKSTWWKWLLGWSPCPLHDLHRPTLTGVVSVLWRTHQVVVLCCPVSEDEQNSEGSEREDGQMGFFGLEAGGEDDAGSSPIKRWRLLMEKEWSRREVCIEQTFWNYFYNPVFCGEPPLNVHNTPVNSPLLIGFDVLVPFSHVSPRHRHVRAGRRAGEAVNGKGAEVAGVPAHNIRVWDHLQQQLHFGRKWNWKLKKKHLLYISENGPSLQPTHRGSFVLFCFFESWWKLTQGRAGISTMTPMLHKSGRSWKKWKLASLWAYVHEELLPKHQEKFKRRSPANTFPLWDVPLSDSAVQSAVFGFYSVKLVAPA